MNNNNDKSSSVIKNVFLGSLTILGMLLAVLYGIPNYIDSRISDKINNQDFIEKVAANIRPSLIFDHNGTYIHESGAEKLLDSLNVRHIGTTPFRFEIKLYPKLLLKTRPIIESISVENFEVMEEKRGERYTWILILENQGMQRGSLERYPIFFRLEILK